MEIQSVKGTRDFYPEDMAKRNFIADLWKRVSLRNGFAEYDGPIFEYLAMYQLKSGDEIASQLFAFEDRGGRMLAIRPEITPTLARMVNQRINTLPRPIKWFSIPRLCRAERPQKGRLREFFQWNIDIIGVDDCLADAEVIFCSVDYLMQTGLTSDDVVVRISSRRLMAALLEYFGIEEQQLEKVYGVLDKKNKVPQETFEKMLEEVISDSSKRQKVQKLMAVESLGQLEDFTGADENANQAIEELKQLFNYLDIMGITEFCKFDIGIVRGLAYYTGIVFEIYDKSEQLRAICGGGRYDNLLADFGGQKISATGMGMGDCVLGIVLEEKGLFKNLSQKNGIEYFVALADESLQNELLKVVARLRRAGRKADFSYKGGSLGKQLKQASAVNAAMCVILGEEFTQKKQLVIKNMDSGQQDIVAVEDFFSRLG
ncbi:MAG: histidine--tRNA ligase [Planctomycetes bacterium]|nr:histidine--tRNA ligase [Planctomycetota bacterium]MBU1518564.1 histidine--tRNA ligase [Planctomycetota bacterium]MBU2597507.1 histidine--tRNA ligase [Planctomycetota bacterium]